MTTERSQDGPAMPSHDADADAEFRAWSEGYLHESPELPLDPAALLDRVTRDDRLQRVQRWVQLGGTLFAALVFTGLVVRSRSAAFAVLAAIVLPVLVALLGLSVHLYRSRGPSVAASVADHVAVTLRRRRADHRLVQATRTAFAFLTVAYWAWYPWLVLARAERFGAQPWRLVVGVLVSLVTLAAGWWYMGRAVRRAEREVEQWQRVASSLGELVR